MTRVLGGNTYSALRANLNRLMIRWDTGLPSSTGTAGGTGALGIDHVLAIAKPTAFDLWAANAIPIGGDRAFGGDADKDGDKNGYEYGVNADGGLPDSNSERKLLGTPIMNGTRIELRFGFRPGSNDLIWILERSSKLVIPEEIFRYDGTDETRGDDIESKLDPEDASRFIVTDKNPGSRAFYHLRVTQKSGG